MTAWRSDRRWLTTARRSMVNESEVFDGDEREIEDQKFMIRPGLGESKTAEGFLRDIKHGIFSALVNKNVQRTLPEYTVVEVVEERRRSKIHQPALSREIQDSYMIPERHRNNHT